MILSPVLSIRQPWVGLIMGGHKWTEIRPQRRLHVGKLWIHSSRWEADAEDDVREEMGDRFCWQTGAIVGHVTMLGSISGTDLERYRDGERSHLSGDELARLDWLVGVHRDHWQDEDFVWQYASFDEQCWNLILAEPCLLAKPIRIGGKLGMWSANVPDGTDLTLAEMPVSN